MHVFLEYPRELRKLQRIPDKYLTAINWNNGIWSDSKLIYKPMLMYAWQDHIYCSMEILSNLIQG